MSAAVLLAAVGGACVVPAAADGLALVDAARLTRAGRSLAAPLLAAGRGGAVTDDAERRRFVAVLAVGALVGGWLLVGPLAGVGLAVLAPATTSWVLRARRERWREALADGAPLAARSLADALAGGHSARGAVLEAARAGGHGRATDAELRRAAGALALGAPTEQVLLQVRDRAGSPAWEVVVAAILLQLRSGGDLAGLLRSIAADQEGARRVFAEARAASAQARFTAWIVAALPLGAAVLAELAGPGTVRHLVGQPVPAALLVVAAVLEVVAVVAVRRLGRSPVVGQAS